MEHLPCALELLASGKLKIGMIMDLGFWGLKYTQIGRVMTPGMDE